VYWRRRAVVLLGLVVLILLIWMIIKAATSGGDEPKVAQTPVESSASAAAESPPVPEAEPCTKGALAIDLTPDSRAFGAGEPVTFTAEVTNTSAIRCALDPAATRIHVTSGSDRIFDSDDCSTAEPGPGQPTLLEAGAVGNLPVSWDRHRSNETCDPGLPEPRPGTYHIIATIAGAKSNDTVFDLR